jgi:hypothetical protein
MSKPAVIVALAGALLVAVAPGDLRAQWDMESLSQPRTGIGATSVGGKALFAGGADGFTQSNVVDVYDEAFGTWSQDVLPSGPRGGVAATAVGDFALFAGGVDQNLDASAVVDILHVPSMTWTQATLSVARFRMGATTVGNKAIFAGGQTGSLFDPAFSKVADIYDADSGLPPSDPLAWSTATLAKARGLPAATTVGDVALFAGGVTSTGYAAMVDLYDDSTGLWSTAKLSSRRVVGTQSAATFGTRAYFAGGFNHQLGGAMQDDVDLADAISDVIDIYDAQTGAWTVDTLSVARGGPASVAVGNTILFAGGNTAPGVSTDLVDVFDAGTDTWLPTTTLSQARGGLVRTAVGGKAFFAGGSADGFTTAVVDVYEPIVSGPWSGLGHALPGTHGYPILLGSGPLTTGSAGALTLSDAAGPGAPAIVFISLAETPSPFKGGTLVPVPAIATFSLLTTGDPGSLLLPWTSWPAGLSGASLFFQYGIQDAGAVHGVALSNALRADVP